MSVSQNVGVSAAGHGIRQITGKSLTLRRVAGRDDPADAHQRQDHSAAEAAVAAHRRQPEGPAVRRSHRLHRL